MNQSCLAVDVGASTVKLEVVADGRLVARTTCPARPIDGLAATLNDVTAVLTELFLERSTVGAACS